MKKTLILGIKLTTTYTRTHTHLDPVSFCMCPVLIHSRGDPGWGSICASKRVLLMRVCGTPVSCDHTTELIQWTGSILWLFLRFVSLFFLSLQNTWIVTSVLLGGVGIASSDILSSDVHSNFFFRNKNSGGMHVNQCSNCSCLYSGLCAARGLEVDQITKEQKNTHLSQSSRYNYSSFAPHLSLFSGRVAFLLAYSAVYFVLVFVLSSGAT